MGLGSFFDRGVRLYEPLVDVVIAVDNLKPAIVEDDEVIRHSIQEKTIVRNKEYGSLKSMDGLLECVSGPQIKVVGGFVEDQEIGVSRCEPR